MIEGSLMHLLHQEEQEEVAQPVNFEIKQQATSLAEVQLTLMQQSVLYKNAAEDCR